MNESALHASIVIAGSLHFCQLPAMAYFRRHVLALSPELDKLTGITRRVFVALAAGIVMTVLGTGTLVLLARDQLAVPSRLSVGLFAFLFFFWGMRTGCQLWYSSLWPRASRGGRVSHRLLLAIFSCQTLLYGYAALALFLSLAA